jgi:hypothetical protein
MVCGAPPREASDRFGRRTEGPDSTSSVACWTTRKGRAVSASHNSRHPVPPEAIVVGYAMSRLDALFLKATGYAHWRTAFLKTGRELGIPPASIKNLRDEFDPFHPNNRQGWHKRPLRVTRQKVMGDLCDVSDEALVELVRRILAHDEEASKEVIRPIMAGPRPAANVAERLLTGRRAETYFMEHCAEALHVARRDLLDLRDSALGFDFGVRDKPQQAIEVKGIKSVKGDILFTDREWREAGIRACDYWLVVVGNLASRPVFRVWMNPRATIQAQCRYQSSVTAAWRSRVTLAN